MLMCHGSNVWKQNLHFIGITLIARLSLLQSSRKTLRTNVHAGTHVDICIYLTSTQLKAFDMYTFKASEQQDNAGVSTLELTLAGHENICSYEHT